MRKFTRIQKAPKYIRIPQDRGIIKKVWIKHLSDNYDTAILLKPELLPLINIGDSFWFRENMEACINDYTFFLNLTDDLLNLWEDSEFYVIEKEFRAFGEVLISVIEMTLFIKLREIARREGLEWDEPIVLLDLIYEYENELSEYGLNRNDK